MLVLKELMSVQSVKSLCRMSRRIIDISEEPVALSLQGELLCLGLPDGRESTIPLQEVQALLVAHPRVSMSASILAALSSHGVATVLCDGSRRPAGIMLPLGEHGRIATRFASQARLSLPTRKKLWRQLVRAKIRNQGALLSAVRGADAGLAAMAKEVLSGDRTNVEAQAAVRYWRRIFADESFRRDPESGGRNSLLNYGYAIIRSSIARAICGAGLHPALGLHHHSRGNPLCLADDLMEPFRPVVDRAVVSISESSGDGVVLDRSSKRQLVEAVSGRLNVKGESRTCFDWQEKFVKGLARVIDGDAERLWVPVFNFDSR